MSGKRVTKKQKPDIENQPTGDESVVRLMEGIFAAINGNQHIDGEDKQVLTQTVAELHQKYLARIGLAFMQVKNKGGG